MTSPVPGREVASADLIEDCVLFFAVEASRATMRQCRTFDDRLRLLQDAEIGRAFRPKLHDEHECSPEVAKMVEYARKHIGYYQDKLRRIANDLCFPDWG